MTVHQPIETPDSIADCNIEQCHFATITQLVQAFAVQDIDHIMSLFAEQSRYCDIRGNGQHGIELKGKQAIEQFFTKQFNLLGDHTYESPKIVVAGNTAFASWTLVLGKTDDRGAPRFDGIDHFALNADSEVTLKRAWLKGQPRLRRWTMLRRPTAIMRNLDYVFRG